MRALRIAKRFISRLGDELSLYRKARRAAKHPNAVFIWIPKTAGTSLYSMLSESGFVKLKMEREVKLLFHNRGRVTFGHMSIQRLLDADLISQEFVNSAFKFCVVRNPYARAVSLYNYLTKVGVFPNWKRVPTFLEFVEIIGSGFVDKVGCYNAKGLSQCNPQADWIDGIPVDMVLKVETLSSSVPRLRKIFGCASLNLEHSNRSEGIDVNDLSLQEIQAVEAVYRRDFEQFSYPFLSTSSHDEC